MTLSNIEQIVAAEVARLANIPPRSVAFSRSATAHGVDSLALLVLRESIERALQVQISDTAWIDFESLSDLVSHVSGMVGAVGPAGVAPAADGSTPAQVTGPRLTAEGHFQDVLEVGMPMTGLNGLAENPLLKYLGHLRWSHLSGICGVPSREVIDAEGHRLYPTFFYVDLQFPEGRDMATFGENDLVRVTSTMEKFGTSMLDGVAYLLPSEWPADRPLAFRSVAEAVAAGVPAARLSNIFVKQFGGAEWLKKSRPANAGFDRVPTAGTPPDSYTIVKAAERDGRFEPPPPGWIPMTDGSVTVEYALVPDRDLNGAGLVYFANYPLFVDMCERRVLRECRFPLSDQALDRRSLLRRRTAYLNNASSRDTLAIEIEAWLYNPALLGQADASGTPLKYLVNARMRRLSDGRLMMVCSAEKVITGQVLGVLANASAS